MPTVREKLLAWLARTDQTKREILLVSLFLLFLVVVGTTGYVVLEGWSWMDGLYMTFITLTTIGFSEVRELSTHGRFFTIVLAVAGIGSVAFIATRTAQLLLTNQRLKERHMRRQIEQLEDHYIICGYGRIGRRIATDLRRDGKGFVVIDNSEDKAEMLEAEGVLHVIGNAELEETLQQAGIERAHGLILTLPEDSSNVFVTLVAKELTPDIYILARTNRHENRRKLLRAGADKVISPYEIGADRMAQVLLRPNVDRFMDQVLRTEGLELLMDEVPVEEGALLAGKSLADSNFRQQFNAIVMAIIDGESGEMQFNPGPGAVIRAGDVLIVMGNQDMLRRLRDEGCRA